MASCAKQVSFDHKAGQSDKGKGTGKGIGKRGNGWRRDPRRFQDPTDHGNLPHELIVASRVLAKVLRGWEPDLEDMVMYGDGWVKVELAMQAAPELAGLDVATIHTLGLISVENPFQFCSECVMDLVIQPVWSSI